MHKMIYDIRIFLFLWFHMNIDMRIRHGDAGRGKGCLQAVEDVIAAGPVILRAGPEAQDVIDRAVAVAGDVGPRWAGL